MKERLLFEFGNGSLTLIIILIWETNQLTGNEKSKVCGWSLNWIR